MKQIIVILSFLIIISCGKKQGNMLVKGQIKGLNKGMLYLKKIKDTSLISVDSIKLFGDSNFQLSDNIESPEMYYLTFKGSSKDNKNLMFFGETGVITINDNIDEFGWKPKITGSKNQKLFEDFKKVDDTYKFKRLQFIVDDNEARALKDTIKIKQLEKDYLKMRARRFGSTIQFALNNKDYEVAPYLALSELFDVNMIYIDSINNNLSTKVKLSKYGKELQIYIDDVKKSEK